MKHICNKTPNDVSKVECIDEVLSRYAVESLEGVSLTPLIVQCQEIATSGGCISKPRVLIGVVIFTLIALLQQRYNQNVEYRNIHDHAELKHMAMSTIG